MTAATARRSTQKKAAVTTAALAALTVNFPELAKGEIYVGALIGADGKGEHVILLAGDQEGLTWSAALAWAKEQGGDLPSRIEQAMLFAHQRKEFKRDWYWSNTQNADDERWAWFQYFGYGHQYTFNKDSQLRVRAVRRVPL